MPDPGQTPTSPLTYAEAEQVAEAILARWTGITGLSAAPSIEQVTDLVQRVLRETAVVVAERGEG
jgi:hypothetical protein